LSQIRDKPISPWATIAMNAPFLKISITRPREVLVMPKPCTAPDLN